MDVLTFVELYRGEGNCEGQFFLSPEINFLAHIKSLCQDAFAYMYYDG